MTATADTFLGNDIYKYIVSLLALKVPMFARSIVDEAVRSIGRTPDNVTPWEMKLLVDGRIGPELRKYLRADTSLDSLGAGLLTVDRNGLVQRMSPVFRKLMSSHVGPQAGDGERLQWARQNGLILSCEDFEMRDEDVVIREFLDSNSGSVYKVTISPTYADGFVRSVTSVIQDVTLLHRLENHLGKLYPSIEERNRTIQYELMLASTVQQGLMPERRVEWRDLRIFVEYLPKDSVGGDFYDIVPLPVGTEDRPDERLDVLVADVTGHGLPSALLTALVKTRFTERARGDRELSEIISATNNDLMDYTRTEYFVTAIYGALRSTSCERRPTTTLESAGAEGLDGAAYTFEYCNAGHVRPFLYRRQSGRCFELRDSLGTMLGVRRATNTDFCNASYTPLFPGDLLVLYTDGVIDVLNEQEALFGASGLHDVIEREGRGGPEHLLGAMIEESRRFSAGEIEDDRLAMVLEVA